MNNRNKAGFVLGGRSFGFEDLERVKENDDIEDRLCEGASEVVTITHIVNPHNFYVQRLSQEHYEIAMKTEFKTAESLPMPFINRIAIGHTYLAQNKGVWQRCRIMGIEVKEGIRLEYTVFFFDYGVTRCVTIDQLRIIPRDRLRTPEPLAYNCGLANCMPITGAWASEDTYMLLKMMNNEDAYMHVRKVHLVDNHEKFECDLTTFKKGVNVAKAFLYHEKVIIVDPQIKFWTPFSVKEKQTISINDRENAPINKEKVYITHVDAPDQLFVRPCRLQPQYDKMCEELYEDFNINSNKNMVYLPVKKLTCALFGEGEWHRCVVRALLKHQRVQVLLPDCGRRVSAHWTRLRYLHRKHHASTPAMTTECHLTGISPPRGGWPAGAVQFLLHYVERPLTVHLAASRQESLAITLYDENVCLNRELINRKLAVCYGLNIFKKSLS